MIKHSLTIFVGAFPRDETSLAAITTWNILELFSLDKANLGKYLGLLQSGANQVQYARICTLVRTGKVLLGVYPYRSQGSAPSHTQPFTTTYHPPVVFAPQTNPFSLL